MILNGHPRRICMMATQVAAMGAVAGPPFTAVAADGWTLTGTGTGPATVSRAGFDNTGSATTITASLLSTTTIRQVYPNQLLDQAGKYASSDFIYAADAISGVTNSSTLVSPKPVGTWGMADRRLVGNSIPWEIIAFHRDAKDNRQIACAWVRATDGTNFTGWQIVWTVSLSTSCETPFQPEVYAGTLDITSLNDDSRITLQKKVFPHYGTAASVLDSTTETEFRASNRYFYKNTTRFAAPNIICVRSTGNDSTGIYSTNEATALATPCLTVGGAFVRAQALLGTANKNALSGLEIRVHDGVSMGTVGFVYVCQDAAAIKITRTTTSASRSAANVTMSSLFRPFSAGNPNSPELTESALLFEDLKITRAADVDFAGEAGRKMHLQMHNVEINFSSIGAAQGMKSNAHLSVFGMTVTNFVGGFAQTTAGDNRILRGLSGSFNNTAIDGYNIIGCSLTAARINTATAQRGFLIYNNFVPNPPASNNAIMVDTASNGQTMAGAVVQNLVPNLTTTGDPSIMISGDGGKGSIVHLVMHHNSTPGDGGYGRWNIDYDETTGVARSHKLASIKGNLGPQFNVKGDVNKSDGTKIGHFPVHHGVGCAGNFTEDPDAAGDALNFGQKYPGIGSVIAGGDPLYIDDRATSLPGPVAGSVGGNYGLQVGSPARGILADLVLTYDINGNARGTGAQAAGAIAA